MSPESESPALLRFVRQYFADRQAGRTRTLSDYMTLFPGAEEAIAETFAELELSREGRTPPTLEAQDGRIGPYKLLGELGRGGQGVVHLALDERLGRKVALKCLEGSGAWFETALARFRREAELVSRLDHPAICVVYDAGFSGNMAFIAMRYVEGETLARRIQKSLDAEAAPNASDVELAIRVTESAARALHAAHEAGVIHRDVKPGNIMILPTGEPVLLDFGLAQDLTSTSLTGTGVGVGTPAYMAPEQVRGDSAAHDRRVDVYALGTVLYETATRRRPHERPNREALFHAIMDDEISDPRLLNRWVSRDLSVVIATATAKDPDGRYPTALAFAEDLRRVRQHEPIRARPTPSLTRIQRWVERNPQAAMSLAAAIVVLVVGLVTSLKWWREAEHRGQDLLAEKAAAAPVHYAAALAAARAAHEAGDDRSAARFLESATPALRGFEWNRLRSCVERAVRVARPGGPNQPVLVAMSPYVGLIGQRENGELVRIDPDGRTPDRPFGSLRASPAMIALADLAGAVLSGEPVEMTDSHTDRTLWSRPDLADVRALGLSHDGSLAAVSCGQANRFVVLDGRSGTPLHEERLEGEPTARITFDGAGTRCLVSSASSSRLLRVSDWTEVWRVPAAFAAFAGRGAVIAAGTNGAFSRLDPATGAVLWTVREAVPNPPTFDADDAGDSLFVIVMRGVVRLDAGTGARLGELCGSQSGMVSVRVLAEMGGVFAGGLDGSIRLFDPRTGPEVRSVPLHADEAFASASSEDGSRFACAGWGSVRTIDAATGELSSCDYVSDDLLQSVVWSGDGTYVVAGGLASGVVACPPGGNPADRKGARCPAPVTALASSRSGDTIFAGLSSGALLAFDRGLAPATPKFAGHRSAIRAMALSPDGRTLATGSGGGGSFTGTNVVIQPGENDTTVRLWDAASGSPGLVLTGHRGAVRVVAWSSDGTRLVSGDAEGVVILWDSRTGSRLGSRRPATEAAIAAAFSTGDQRIAVGYQEGLVCVFDGALEWDSPIRLSAPGLTPRAFRWSAQGLSASGGEAGLAAFDAARPAAGLAACDVAERAARLLRSQTTNAQVTSAAVQKIVSTHSGAPREIREAALARAARAGDHPAMLNNLAWSLALYPGKSDAALGQAHDAAVAAVRSRPDSWGLLNTLALVEYRLGRFREAISTTERAQALRGKSAPPLAADLVIRAMAHLRAGERAAAAAALEEARKAPDRSDVDVIRLMAEAEELSSKP